MIPASSTGFPVKSNSLTLLFVFCKTRHKDLQPFGPIALSAKFIATNPEFVNYSKILVKPFYEQLNA